VLFRRSAAKIGMTLSLGFGLGLAAATAGRRNPHPDVGSSGPAEPTVSNRKPLASAEEDARMAELTADLFVSLDGFAAGIDAGPFFGYSGPELDSWISGNLKQPHIIVMGRVTYQALAEISASATDEGSTRMSDLPKVVISNTLAEPLTWANTRLVRGDPATGIRELKRRSEMPLRSIGSLSLVGSMMRLGLVDRLRIMVFPLILGDAGREPFSAGHSQAGLKLMATEILDSRLVMLEYRPAGLTRQ
jgi:dihydrofolate reductase